MRCLQCQFENIPGQDRCLRCGSVLEAAVMTGSVYPPRMARWKRPVRAVIRWFRRQGVVSEAIPKPKVPDFLKIMSANTFLGVVLSIVPGLAHYIDGRFREICWFVLGWFLALAFGVYFYSSSVGLLALGFVVGIHSWVVFNHSLSKELTELSGKIRTLIVTIIVFGLIYTGIRSIVFRDFVFGYTNLTIPYQNVQSGDLLLARRSLLQASNLNRGAVVLAPMVKNIYGGYGHQGQVLRRGPLMAGQIVGLAGEQVEVINGSFVVDGKTLDTERYPVPEWLRGNNFGAIHVPDASFFVSTVYNVNGHGMVLNADLVGQACVVRSSDIEAKPAMRWFPLARRGFLRAGE